MSEYCQPSARFEMSGISPVGHGPVGLRPSPQPSPRKNGEREQTAHVAPLFTLT